MQIRLVMLPRVRTSILYMYAVFYHFLFARATLIYGKLDFTKEKKIIYNCISFPNLGQHKQRGNRTNGLSMIKISVA
uniref:Uncharacterized protein n=1 Tax=Anopheles marajoara TaxID=58244 RepID=A0A2M4C598_9DIPT